MVRTLSWNCRRRGIEMSLLSPGIAILFEHSEWFQPLFAGLDRRGIAYDRLLAAELSYDPRARTSQYSLVVNRMGYPSSATIQDPKRNPEPVRGSRMKGANPPSAWDQ